MNKIDAAATASFATPFLVKSSEANSSTYLVSNKAKRKFIDAAEAASALPLVNGGVVQVWSPSAIAAITSSTNVMAPGTIVKVKESGNVYLLDGWAKGWRLSATAAAAFAATTPKVVTRANLTGYNTASALPWQKLVCGSSTYVVDGGKLLQLDEAAISQWPSTATALDPNTCARLAPTTTRLGVFISVGTKKYKVIAGKLKRIRTTADYTTMVGNLTPAVPVSQGLVDQLPKLNPTSYVVISGDTLYKVAVKFKTTRAVLRTLNNLTTDVLTKGQVLILP
jgi:LysM repeat protein